jgi:branched-chain amino acid aminotransferase
VLELARERLMTGSKYLTTEVKDLEVIERDFTMLEVEKAWKEGRIVEAFLSGTAVSLFRVLVHLVVLTDAC